MGVTIDEAALKADIDLYMNTYCNTIARIAIRELNKAAAEAMNLFYNAYTPVWYDRTFNLRFNSYRYYYARQGSGRNVYVGGVTFDSGEMDAYDNGYSTATVLDMSLRGFHGSYIYEQPEPLEHLLKHRDYILEFGNINRFAHKAAQSKKHQYKVLRF